VATPIRTDIRKRFKTMWNAMVNFLLVTVLQGEINKMIHGEIKSFTPVLDFDMHLVTTFS